MRLMRGPAYALLPLCGLLLTTGCAPVRQPSVAADSPLRGVMHGGQQPISGATVQLYAVSLTQDGGPATALLSPAPITNAAGEFTFPAYICPSPSSLVYVVGTGGNPGFADGTNNQQSVLMAALGGCGNLTSTTYISVNELTTVASLFPLTGFAASYTAVGSTVPDSLALAAEFAEVGNLVNTSTGTLPGASLPAGLSVPASEIYSLADVVAACVNSTGGVAGDGSACGNLFTLATPSGGAAPTDTVGALIDIFENPTMNVAQIFDLTPPNGPYQPTLSTMPADWTVRLTPTLPAASGLIGQWLLTEGSGTVAHDTSGNGNDGTIAGPVWEGSADLNFVPQQTINLPVALNAAKSWQFAMYAPPFGNAGLPLAPGVGYGVSAGDASSFAQNPSILCGTDYSQLCLLAGTPGKSLEFVAQSTDQTQSGVALAPGWHIVSFLCGSQVGNTVSKSHILYDGAEVSSYIKQGDTGTCPAPTAGNFQIGGSSNYGGVWYVGKLGAAWAWNTELSVNDAAIAASTAMSYLKSKGVPTVFSNANNPTPLLVTGLDSRTKGFGLTNYSDDWAYNLQLTQPMTTVNVAVAGSTVFDTCLQFDTLYGEQLPANGTGQVILALWGAINDIDIYQQSAATIAANLQCLVTKAKARGALVVLATEISSLSGRGTAADDVKNALDPILRANAFAWGVDNLADLATDPHIGVDGASSSTTYFADQVHPTSAAEPFVTTIMQDAINELLGATQSAPHITSATTYQETAGDGFLNLTGTATQTVTLPSCLGYSRVRSVTAGAAGAELSTLNGETLSGSASIAANATATITPVPGPMSTGGCSWSRN